jgi:hypothetical protein
LPDATEKRKKTVVVEFQPEFMQSEDFSHLDDVLEKEKEFQKLGKCIEGLNEEQKTSSGYFTSKENAITRSYRSPVSTGTHAQPGTKWKKKFKNMYG